MGDRDAGLSERAPERASGDDKIKILEDTNGDGRADKVTVFADRLNIPTSMAFANDGVIVTQPPHTLFLKDTNGDDKADVREVLHSGWGTQDTHAVSSNIQYAPDNHIWGVVGYSGFKGRSAASPSRSRRPHSGSSPMAARASNILTGSTNNTWGLGFSETFDVFGSTANNDPSFYMAIPNRYFEGIQGLPSGPFTGRGVGPGYQSSAAFYAVHPLTPYIRQLRRARRHTAAAGHYLYTARSFPKGTGTASRSSPSLPRISSARRSWRSRVELRCPRRLEPARGR